MTLSAGALLVTGVGLVLAGLAHAWLPRVLGWTPRTHTEAGPLSALVVRMHVYFVGLFLLTFGGLAVVIALAPPSVAGAAVCGSAALVFAARAVAEVLFVGPVVRTGPRTLVRLHRVALVVWPALVAVFAVAGVGQLTA